MADWSFLPADLIPLISQHLHTSTDLLRFRSVCHTWRAAAPPPPPTVTRFSIVTGTSKRFDLSRRTVYLLQSWLPDRHSSWIIKLGCTNPDRMHLLHPINERHFEGSHTLSCLIFQILGVRELEEEYTLEYANCFEVRHLYKKKVAILSHKRGGFVVLVIDRWRHLVVYKSGDEKWRSIINHWRNPPYEDIIYVVNKRGGIFLVNRETIYNAALHN